MSPSPRRQSAQDRLARLGRVFAVEDLQEGQGLSAKAASVYLARWQAQGLIARLGRRCGLWVNFAQPGGTQVAWADRVKALVRKHPMAVVGGMSALAVHGWVEADAQVDTCVLIPQGFSRAQVDGFVLHTRAPRGHSLLRGLARPHPRMGLATLPGEVAVADLVAQGQEVSRLLRQRAGDIGELIQKLGGKA